MAPVLSTEPLPRGRHKLSQEEVAASQRARLLRALVVEVHQRGYDATSVANVVATARVSRETFYAYHASKADCFWAAHEALLQDLEAAVAAGAAEHETPMHRLHGGLRAGLEHLAADEAAAHCLLLDRPDLRGERTATEAALHRRAVEALMRLLRTGDRFACEAYAALVQQSVADRLAAGKAQTLPALAAPIVALIERQVRGAAEDTRFEQLLPAA